VITQLRDLCRHAAEYAMRDGRIAEDDSFYTEQNARPVHNAEHYYRTMYQGEVLSWNLRDRPMAAEAVGSAPATGSLLRRCKTPGWGRS